MITRALAAVIRVVMVVASLELVRVLFAILVVRIYARALEELGVLSVDEQLLVLAAEDGMRVKEREKPGRKNMMSKKRCQTL